MKHFLDCTLIGFIWILSFVIGATFMVYSEKAALEIKILQHELKAYEDMEKELGNEPTIEP